MTNCYGFLFFYFNFLIIGTHQKIQMRNLSQILLKRSLIPQLLPAEDQKAEDGAEAEDRDEGEYEAEDGAEGEGMRIKLGHQPAQLRRDGMMLMIQT